MHMVVAQAMQPPKTPAGISTSCSDVEAAAANVTPAARGCSRVTPAVYGQLCPKQESSPLSSISTHTHPCCTAEGQACGAHGACTQKNCRPTRIHSPSHTSVHKETHTHRLTD